MIVVRVGLRRWVFESPTALARRIDEVHRAVWRMGDSPYPGYDVSAMNWLLRLSKTLLGSVTLHA